MISGGVKTSSATVFRMPAYQISICGARYNGIQQTVAGEGLVLFTDPVTQTTMGLLESQVTVAAIRRKLRAARDLFREAMLQASRR